MILFESFGVSMLTAVFQWTFKGLSDINPNSQQQFLFTRNASVMVTYLQSACSSKLSVVFPREAPAALLNLVMFGTMVSDCSP
jgi:hypothetical protein